MTLAIEVPISARGMRLDKYLGTLDSIQSRSRALLLIEKGQVLLNGELVKASFVLRGGEELTVILPETEPLNLQPLELKLEILYEDEALIVLNKPPGLVVHPAAGHAQDTLVNALIHHTSDFAMKFGEHRPGIVHRLDKDTSGIMVIAKTDAVQEALAEQFKSRTIHRRYVAIVCGLMKQDSGTIKSYLARHPTDRKRFASIRDRQRKVIDNPNYDPGVGKWAQTDFQVLKRHPSGLSYVRLKLHTGRTHQIRVHLSELGHPILGDVTYGASKKMREVPRFALHAAELGFQHPVSGENMFYQIDWPADLKGLVDELFGKVS